MDSTVANVHATAEGVGVTRSDAGRVHAVYYLKRKDSPFAGKKGGRG